MLLVYINQFTGPDRRRIRPLEVILRKRFQNRSSVLQHLGCSRFGHAIFELNKYLHRCSLWVCFIFFEIRVSGFEFGQSALLNGFDRAIAHDVVLNVKYCAERLVEHTRESADWRARLLNLYLEVLPRLWLGFHSVGSQMPCGGSSASHNSRLPQYPRNCRVEILQLVASQEHFSSL